MLKLDTAIELDFAKFFRWWTGELAFLIPAPLRKILGGASRYLMLSRDEQGLAVALLSPGGVQPLGRLPLDETCARQREQLLQDNPELAEIKTLLRLNPGQSLRKTLKLPFAAEENLNQVLAFEMDRLTPFKSDQVYYGARITSRIAATRQLAVELVLTPRSKLDALLEELAACGWRPDLVDMAGDTAPGAYNLLPEKYRTVGSRWPRLLSMGFASLCVVFISLMAVLPIMVASSTADALDEQVQKVGKTAKEVEALRQELDALQHQARFLEDKKRNEPVLLDMLEELTRVMPDNTWLNGLQYREKRIVIQGQSPSASSLIELIEGSEHFKNTSFVSPVTKDVGSGLERFQIASDVLNGRFSGKPTATEPPAPAVAPTPTEIQNEPEESVEEPIEDQ